MHIHNLATFQTLTYLELEAYPKRFEILSRHLQNPPMGRGVYSSIIKPYLSILETLCNACICRNLAYSESWNTQYPSIIALPRIFKTLPYFRKWVNPKVIIIFPKRSTLISLTGFWIDPSHDNYSLTCRVTSCYVLYETYSESFILS